MLPHITEHVELVLTKLINIWLFTVPLNKASSSNFQWVFAH